jgi:hypothetical protein
VPRGISAAKEDGMPIMANEAAMRKREHDLIDRQELDHYHRTIEILAEKRSPQDKEEAKKKHRRELYGLIMGDRTHLEKFREMKFSKEVAAHYDDRREAVDKMTREQLLEQRRRRVIVGKSLENRSPGRG